MKKTLAIVGTTFIGALGLSICVSLTCLLYKFPSQVATIVGLIIGLGILLRVCYLAGKAILYVLDLEFP
jgi:hypothetical protein